MAIDPRSLRILLAVHRAGSFTGAAQELAMSQPSISVAIRQLENRTGVEMVRRDRKGAELTDAGLLLVGRAAAIENILLQAEREVAGRHEHVLGPLRIAGTPGALLALMPQSAGVLHGRQARFVIEAAEAKDEELIPMLRARSIDLALCTVVGDIATPDIEQTVLRREPFCLVCRTGFLAGVSELSIAESARLPWVMPLAQGATRRQLEAVFLSAGVPPPQTVIRCDGLATMKEIVQAADFVMLLPASVVQPELARGSFRPIHLKGGPPPRDLGLLRLSQEAPTPAMREFIAAARESDA